jgi:hypothetical protein
MPIGSLPPGQKPRVHEHEGEVVIWSGDTKDPIGVLFSAEAGVDVGLECLTVATKLLNRPIAALQTEVSIEDNVIPDEDVAGRLLITIEGAPFELHLSATQICEFAATFAAMARRFD